MPRRHQRRLRLASWGIIAVDDAGRHHRDCQVDARTLSARFETCWKQLHTPCPARPAHHSQDLEGTWKALGRHLEVAMSCDLADPEPHRW